MRIVEKKNDTFLKVNNYKKYPVGIRVKQFIDAIQKWTKEYGARVKDNDDGVDWKSISHAYRVLDEIQCLIDNNLIKFPLDTADKILKIKQGKYPFKEVINELDKKLESVGDQLQESDLRGKPQYNFKDEYILGLYKWE